MQHIIYSFQLSVKEYCQLMFNKLRQKQRIQLQVMLKQM